MTSAVVEHKQGSGSAPLTGTVRLPIGQLEPEGRLGAPTTSSQVHASTLLPSEHIEQNSYIQRQDFPPQVHHRAGLVTSAPNVSCTIHACRAIHVSVLGGCQATPNPLLLYRWAIESSQTLSSHVEPVAASPPCGPHQTLVT